MKKNNINPQINDKEKEEQFSKNNKINQNSIINKIHSIQASINSFLDIQNKYIYIFYIISHS